MWNKKLYVDVDDDDDDVDDDGDDTASSDVDIEKPLWWTSPGIQVHRMRNDATLRLRPDRTHIELKGSYQCHQCQYHLSLSTPSSPLSYWQPSTPSPSVLPGLFSGRLTTRKTCALWEKNWRKPRMRQLTNGRFLLKCWLLLPSQSLLISAKSIFFIGTLTLTPGLQWKAGTAGRKPLQAMFLCPTFRLVKQKTNKYSMAK